MNYMGKRVKTCCARGIEVLVFRNGLQALTYKAFREFRNFLSTKYQADRVWMSVVCFLPLNFIYTHRLHIIINGVQE